MIIAFCVQLWGWIYTDNEQHVSALQQQFVYQFVSLRLIDCTERTIQKLSTIDIASTAEWVKLYLITLVYDIFQLNKKDMWILILFINFMNWHFGDKSLRLARVHL